MRDDVLLVRRAGSVLVLAVLPLPAALHAQLPPTIGLTTAGGQWFTNDDPTSTLSDGKDRFAEALAVGDFNGDGADDLATGVPHDDAAPTQEDTGSVVVRYGVRGGGLAIGPPALVLRKFSGAQAYDHFGEALAAGDFNGDGFDDLAVGAPWNYFSDRGAVFVYYGTPGGLQLDGMEIFDESVSPEPEHVCDGAHFGTSLAVGDFDGDPYADLAIGARGACQLVGDELIAGGAVFVAHGQDFGLLPFYGYRISQDSYAIGDSVQAGDEFGRSVAAGDFDHDGYDDLAIGVPGEGSHSEGAVEILMGSQWGLLFEKNALWFPGALGEVPEPHDELGASLAAGDFDGDGFDDLAIGSPWEDLGPGGVYIDTGSIAVAYGAADPDWFDLARTDHLAQSSVFGDEIHEAKDDFFGWAIAAGDFDADERDDLAIGAYGDDWSGANHGAVTIVMGAAAGIGTSTRFYLIGVGWDGVPGDAAQEYQYSGWSVATGDFDGNGYADLAIGVPTYDQVQYDVGGEALLYGAPYGALLSDGFELGALVRWSAATP